MLRTVAPFQLAAWGCKIGVAFSVLAAFEIEAGLAMAALVVVFNGMSTAVPVPVVWAPSRSGRYALRGVAPLTGAISFSVGLQVGITTVNTLVGLMALMLMLRTFRPLAAIGTVAVTLVLALQLFLQASVRKGALSWRRPERRCPACGRLKRSCICSDRRGFPPALSAMELASPPGPCIPTPRGPGAQAPQAS